MKSILAAPVAAISLALAAEAQLSTPPIPDIPYYANGVSAPSCSGNPAFGPMQSLDVYLATPPAAGPTVLYVHGGGWTSGDKAGTDHQLFAQTLQGLGHNVVSINYTLTCAGLGYEQAIRDVRAALAWVRGPGASAPFLLSSCIVAVGGSAGGHLVSIAATVADSGEAFFKPVGAYQVASLRPDAVLAISAPEDFYRSGAVGMASSPCSQPFPGCSASFPPGYTGGTLYSGWVSAYLGCAWNSGLPCASLPCTPTSPVWSDPCLKRNHLTGNSFVDASPIHWVSPADPPFHLVYTDCDGKVPGIESVWMYSALRSSGVPVNIVDRDQCGHAFTMFTGGSSEAANYCHSVISLEFSGYCP